MLARCAPRSNCILRRTCYKQPQLGLSLNQSRRTFVSLDILKDGFLDLAIALPIPPSWPAYSTTIILCTLLTRLAFTVPFSLWVSLDSFLAVQIFADVVQSKQRQWRAEEQVLPRLQSEGPMIAKRILEDMQREKVRGPKEELQTIHRTRMKTAVRSYPSAPQTRTERVPSGCSPPERTVHRIPLSPYNDDGPTIPHSVARFRWVLCRTCTLIAAPHTV